MKAFRVVGHYPASKKKQDFTIDVVASDKEDAEHRLYSHIGSRHRVQRRHITIESIDNDRRRKKEINRRKVPEAKRLETSGLTKASGKFAYFENNSQRSCFENDSL